MKKNPERKLIRILVFAAVFINLLCQLATADEILTDRSGNKIGSIVTQSNGILVARDRSGNKVGEYDPRSNETRDRSGNKIGGGNQLAALIR
ncbi:MAG: hypothetical protein QOG92_1231 [Verrucomicrobiota bacterium]|jgi:hypothetical protein|nr:hypothetical protein [Verrucomicrobiota bacterium]